MCQIVSWNWIHRKLFHDVVWEFRACMSIEYGVTRDVDIIGSNESILCTHQIRSSFSSICGFSSSSLLFDARRMLFFIYSLMHTIILRASSKRMDKTHAIRRKSVGALHYICFENTSWNIKFLCYIPSSSKAQMSCNIFASFIRTAQNMTDGIIQLVDNLLIWMNTQSFIEAKWSVLIVEFNNKTKTRTNDIRCQNTNNNRTKHRRSIAIVYLQFDI